MRPHLKLEEITQPILIDWCSIFNTYDFFKLHQSSKSHYFALTDTSKQSIAGICHFTETEPGVFRSPRRGTFAGPELQNADSETLVSFIGLLENALIEKKAKQIDVLSAPFLHHPAFSEQLHHVMIGQGYTVSLDDKSYLVEIDGVELPLKMNADNRRRFKKCIGEGSVFQQVHTEEEYKSVYKVIEDNYLLKGYHISMRFEDILQMQRAFPDSLYFFKASLNGAILASSICIRISAHVLYVFYWGDKAGYGPLSPICFLANGIYQFARQKNFEILDVGVSSVNGQPIQGLINFKENLGLKSSPKLTYRKNL